VSSTPLSAWAREACEFLSLLADETLDVVAFLADAVKMCSGDEIKARDTFADEKMLSSRAGGIPARLAQAHAVCHSPGGQKRRKKMRLNFSPKMQ